MKMEDKMLVDIAEALMFRAAQILHRVDRKAIDGCVSIRVRLGELKKVIEHGD